MAAAEAAVVVEMRYDNDNIAVELTETLSSPVGSISSLHGEDVDLADDWPVLNVAERVVENSSSSESFSEIFKALGDVEIDDGEGRSRFIAAQWQMLEQITGVSGSTSHHGVDLNESMEFDLNGIEISERRNSGLDLHRRRRLARTRRMRTLSDDFHSAPIQRDIENNEVDNDEFFLRVQLELLRRLGLYDEEIIPVEDLRPVQECQVCYNTVRLTARQCCQKAVCDECLLQYVETQIVDNGILRIGCPNPDCNNQIYSEEIRSILRTKPEIRDRYDRWIVDLNGDPKRKTCPRCCHITELTPTAKNERNAAKYGVRIECTECHLEWCFTCQAPWHEGISCKRFQAGDVLLKSWARQRLRFGECNAQRCPKCKVYIQRTEGCDHMTCSRCSTEFCYRCGCRRLPSLKLFGYPLEDHDLKHSIIGCNNDYKQGKPVQRALSRGALFGAKVVGGAVAVPVVVGLAAGAVGLAAGVAAVALPAYGTYRLARKIRDKVREHKS